MDASDLAEFNQQAVPGRFALFGKPIKLDDVDGTGVYSSPRRTDQLASDGGGYKVEITSTLRIRKSDWPAYNVAADFFKKEVQINLGNDTWQRFRIADQGVVDVHQAGEWKLDLEALT